MVFRFVEENNMFKVKTAENAKQDELTLTPGGETDDHRTCIYP